MLKILLLAGPLLLAASLGRATTVPPGANPCVKATLASYIASRGCTMEGLFFNNFSFQVASVSGGAVPIGASDIAVTPLAVSNSDGLTFTSGGFSVTGTGAVSYIIGYTEDPEGDIRSMDDVLDDPVIPPGVGRSVSQGCLGFSFSTNCSGPTVSISVFDDGIAPRLTDSVTFVGVNTLGEQTRFPSTATAPAASRSTDSAAPLPWSRSRPQHGSPCQVPRCYCFCARGD